MSTPPDEDSATPPGARKFAGVTRFAHVPADVLPMRFALLSFLLPAAYVTLASSGFIAVNLVSDEHSRAVYLTGWDLLASDDWQSRLIFVCTVGTPACGLLLGLAGVLRKKLSRAGLVGLAFPPTFSLMSTGSFLIAEWSVAGIGLLLQPVLAVVFLVFLFFMRHDLKRVTVKSLPSPALPPSDSQRLWRVIPTELNLAADELEAHAADPASGRHRRTERA